MRNDPASCHYSGIIYSSTTYFYLCQCQYSVNICETSVVLVGSVSQFMEDIQNGRYMELLTTSKCQEVYCRYLDNSCDSVALDVLLEKSVKTYMDHNCTTPSQ
jgi:hypothetical protein